MVWLFFFELGTKYTTLSKSSAPEPRPLPDVHWSRCTANWSLPGVNSSATATKAGQRHFQHPARFTYVCAQLLLPEPHTNMVQPLLLPISFACSGYRNGTMQLLLYLASFVLTILPGVMVHARNPSIREGEAEGFPCVQRQPGLQSGFKDSLNCRAKPWLTK